MITIQCQEWQYRKAEQVLKVFGRSYVYTLLKSLNKTPKRFSELMRETGVNPCILSRNLKTLTEMEVIEKLGDLYTLTEKGRTSLELVDEILSIF